MSQGTTTPSTARRHRIIERPRLTRALDNSDARIKMLVAPAGYGKTTLARQWLAGKKAAWYSGTQASRDVAALSVGLQGTASCVVPGCGKALLERVPVTADPEKEVDVLAAMLAEDLVDWPHDAWLVLDDYQYISGVAGAEKFVDGLLLGAPINLLILTRRRPTWVSSRRLLYGEVFELARPQLAMNNAEAQRLLAEAERPSNLIELSEGWPAVLALASVSDTPPPDILEAPHLYNFFAEELYSRIDRRTRRTLCELALYGVAGRGVMLQSLRTEEAERVLRVGADSGFITQTHSGGIEMHPLLCSFLERKLREDSVKRVNAALARVIELLLENRLWDEAFSVIHHFQQDALLADLIDVSLDDILASGRSSTLQTWLVRAPQGAPAVRLATAELAFREGRFFESTALASLAARDQRSDPQLRSRAFLVAARAAHAASREEEALRLYQNARTASSLPHLRRAAMYGELAAAIELELEDHARELIRSLGPADALEPHDRVVLADRKINLEGHFGAAIGLEEGWAANQLLGFVADPIARCSFRNVFGYALAVCGRYEDALNVTDEQLDDALRFRLEFVIPYALIVRGLAYGGLRDYSLAEEALLEADERACGVNDWTARHTTQGIRTRLLNAQGAFDLAIALPLPAGDDLPRATFAELCSSQAVAYAGHGDIERAIELAQIGEHHSFGVEARIGAACARAIAALRAGAHDESLVEARLALRRATRSGVIEPFVCAYRGCPSLIVSLLADREVHIDLKRVLTTAGDGLHMSTDSDHSVMKLSRREKEVLSLVARGMSNSQIGAVLFISPATAKVHVRHIFEKLGVSSRAEAVLRASQLNR